MSLTVVHILDNTILTVVHILDNTILTVVAGVLFSPLWQEYSSHRCAYPGGISLTVVHTRVVYLSPLWEQEGYLSPLWEQEGYLSPLYIPG